MQEYERLKELVEAAADDVAKASGGNKAAGTRVRKSMQEIKEVAQTVRKRILEGLSPIRVVGVVVQIPQRFKVEGDIVLVPGNDYRRLPEGMSESKLVQHVRVPAGEFCQDQAA